MKFCNTGATRGNHVGSCSRVVLDAVADFCNENNLPGLTVLCVNKTNTVTGAEKGWPSMKGLESIVFVDYWIRFPELHGRGKDTVLAIMRDLAEYDWSDVIRRLDLHIPTYAEISDCLFSE